MGRDGHVARRERKENMVTASVGPRQGVGLKNAARFAVAYGPTAHRSCPRTPTPDAASFAHEQPRTYSDTHRSDLASYLPEC